MSLSPASAAASSSASSARPKLLLATCTDGGPLVPVDGSVKVYTCGPPRLFLNGLPAPGSLLRAYTLYRTRSRTHMLMVMDFNTVIDNDSGNNEGGGVIPVAAATAAAPVASAAGQEQKQVQPEVDKAALQEQLRRPQPEEPVVSEEPRRQEDKAPDQGPAAMHEGALEELMGLAERAGPDELVVCMVSTASRDESGMAVVPRARIESECLRDVPLTLSLTEQLTGCIVCGAAEGGVSGAGGVRRRRCGGCNAVRYCGEAWARLHWPVHKKQCAGKRK
ncbi:hypothetical protein HYH02_010273 [Chlamydomonas schloesseri]|uniref:MYND-type domain-containing protein n=1 Tax=Chlamydomonas schloesseri TaxID=2026947 RepID=A0A835W7M8_9CHLO|nr:hypothetical protein HYH02_010273 [Chlamydomonas schloesseri]|eukprot:KAG2440383.1 hypothetical protein HYH02_010273 [Chlamydomonas schloesseri]